MAEKINLAKAYVTIVPSLEGAQQSLTEQLTGVSATAGTSAGSSAGSAFNTSFGSVLATAGGVAVGVAGAMAAGIAAGTSALVNFTREGASYADEVLTMSTNTHIATDELQAYMYAAELVDVSTETMTSSMARNIRSMNSAAEGTGAAAEAYAALGVSVTDAEGNLRDSQEVYWELIDALGEVDDYTQRDALSMTIFGRSAQDLNSLIAVGSEGMAEFAQQAEDAGAVLDSDTLGAFGEFDDVMQQLDSGVSAAENALGTVLLPVLTQLGGEGVGLLGEFTTGILEADGDIEKIGETIESLIPRAMDIINQFLPTVVSLGGSVISALVNAILSNLGSILTTAGSILETLGTGIISVLPTLAPIASELIVNLVSFVVDNLGTVVSSALQIILAVCDGITNALPELIPAAVSAVIEIQNALIDNVDILIPAALQLAIALGVGLVNATPEIIAGIPSIIASIISEFSSLGTQLQASAGEWAADMIESFVNGIRNLLGQVASAASDIASTIASYIGFSEPERGPLSEFHTFAPDMIDLFDEGIEDATPELEATLQRNLVLPTVGAAESLALDSYDAGSSDDSMTPVNIFIGQEKLDTILLRTSKVATYRRGG